MTKEFLENYWRSLADRENEILQSNGNFPLHEWLSKEMVLLYNDTHLFEFIKHNIRDIIEPYFKNSTTYKMGIATAHFTFRISHGFPFDFLTHKEIIQKYRVETGTTREVAITRTHLGIFDDYLEEVGDNLPDLGFLINTLKNEPSIYENEKHYVALFIWGATDTAIPLIRTYDSLTDKAE